MKLLGSVRLFHALRSSAFTCLWIGQTISSLGDGAFNIALVWQILLLTGSGTALGIVMIAEMIPTLLLLLIGGVVADRFPRRFVVLCSDTIRMIATLIIAILSWLGLLQLWHLIVLAIIFGAAQSFFYPAYQALIPQLIKNNDQRSANALTRLSKKTGSLLGPMIGASCIALAGPTSAFALDGFTFAASAYSLLMLQGFATAKEIPSEDIAKDNLIMRKPSKISSLLKFFKNSIVDVQVGLKYILSSTWLWLSILVTAVVNIGLEGALDVALPKLVYNVYHTDAWLLGALYTAFAAGSIICTIIFAQLSNLRHRGIWAYIALIVSTSSLIVLGVPLKGFIAWGVSILATLFIGLGLGFFGLIWVTLLQELVPEDKLGRVNSIDWLCSFGLTPIGYILTGILTDRMSPSWTFIFSGILGLIMVVTALNVKSIRYLE